IQWIFPAGYAGFVVGGLVALATTIVGLGLVFGGRALRRRGDDVALETLEKAMFALAEHRGGALTADEAASALDVSQQTADSVLTGLAKRPTAHVALEVTDDGTLVYLFPGAARRRVDGSAEQRRVRVADATASSAASPTGTAPSEEIETGVEPDDARR